MGAGLGKRLAPLTDKTPKVMVKIGRRPLLYYHLKLLKKHGFDDIWINLHKFPSLIRDYLGDGSEFGVKISYSYEVELLGTAGALKNPKSGIEKEFRKGRFLVVYGDNLTDFDYSKLIKFHRLKKPMMSIAVYTVSKPVSKGIVETDFQKRVVRFKEKPEESFTNQVNGGIYLCEPEILDYIPAGFSDFGFDVLPNLLRANLPVFALDPEYYFQDIGTFEGLKKARRDFKTGKVRGI